MVSHHMQQMLHSRGDRDKSNGGKTPPELKMIQSY